MMMMMGGASVFLSILLFSWHAYGTLYGVAQFGPFNVNFYAVSVQLDTGTLVSLNSLPLYPISGIATIFNGSYYYILAYAQRTTLCKFDLTTGRSAQVSFMDASSVAWIAAGHSEVYLTSDVNKSIILSKLSQPNAPKFNFSEVAIDNDQYMYASTIDPDTDTYYILLYADNTFVLDALSLPYFNHFRRVGSFTCPGTKGSMEQFRFRIAPNLYKFVGFAQFDSGYFYIAYDGNNCNATYLGDIFAIEAIYDIDYDASTSTFYYSFINGPHSYIGVINAATGGAQETVTVNARLESMVVG